MSKRLDCNDWRRRVRPFSRALPFVLPGLLFALHLQAQDQPSLKSLGFVARPLNVCIHFEPQGSTNQESKQKDLQNLFEKEVASGLAKTEVIPGVTVAAPMTAGVTAAAPKECVKGAWVYSVTPAPTGKTDWALTLGPEAGKALYAVIMPFKFDGDVLAEANRVNFPKALRLQLVYALQQASSEELRLEIYKHLYPISDKVIAHLSRGWCPGCVILPLDVKDFGLFLRSKFKADYEAPTGPDTADLEGIGQFCPYDENHHGPLAKTMAPNPEGSDWSNVRLREFSAADPIKPCRQKTTVIPGPMPAGATSASPTKPESRN